MGSSTSSDTVIIVKCLGCRAFNIKSLLNAQPLNLIRSLTRRGRSTFEKMHILASVNCGVGGGPMIFTYKILNTSTKVLSTEFICTICIYLDCTNRKMIQLSDKLQKFIRFKLFSNP